MPLNERNTRSLYNHLYLGQTEKITILKRNDDMDAAVVTPHVIYRARWSRILKHGQPIAGDEATDHFRQLHIPRSELDRVGILHINVLDRFVDKKNRTWQPETNQVIRVQLFENEICVDCRRCDGVVVPGV